MGLSQNYCGNNKNNCFKFNEYIKLLIFNALLNKLSHFQ